MCSPPAQLVHSIKNVPHLVRVSVRENLLYLVRARVLQGIGKLGARSFQGLERQPQQLRALQLPRHVLRLGPVQRLGQRPADGPKHGVHLMGASLGRRGRRRRRSSRPCPVSRRSRRCNCFWRRRRGRRTWGRSSHLASCPIVPDLCPGCRTSCTHPSGTCSRACTRGRSSPRACSFLLLRRTTTRRLLRRRRRRRSRTRRRPPRCPRNVRSQSISRTSWIGSSRASTPNRMTSRSGCTTTG
mmetsp:Transcript_81730/g.230045  ORF Transcript_81730/g.230045 Transcript_81730/m.230045 type:complete len:242 (+) Transcript_81730:335-1060(+)